MKRSDPSVFAPFVSTLPCDPHDVIAALEPLVVSERLHRIESVIAQRIDSVIAVIESLADPHNASAVLRTCDGLGVQEVHIVEPDPKTRITSQITRGCEKWMDIVRHNSPDECVSALKKRGFTVLVADMRAPELWTIGRAEVEPRIAVVFGNEHRGVSPEMRACADGAVAIPMRGMVESFNVSVAAAITLFALTRNRTPGLADDTALALKARFLMESVRESEWVLERYLKTHARASVEVQR